MMGGSASRGPHQDAADLRAVDDSRTPRAILARHAHVHMLKINQEMVMRGCDT
jgi:hypothetical protein